MPTLSLALGTVMAVVGAVGLIRPSRSESAWRKGATGERRVGRALDALAKHSVYVLHDRAMPGSRANIDHVVVTGLGVFVVDSKRYAGKLEVRSRGSQLWINGRNRSNLLEQVRRQAEAVREVLTRGGLPELPVTPVLCFVDTELPLLFPPREVVGVMICTRRSLGKRITKGSVKHAPDQVAGIAGTLDAALRRAGEAGT